MTTLLSVVLSYRKLSTSARLPTPQAEAATPVLLDRMTINFRLSFWRIFQRVWRIDFAQTDVSVFGLPAHISQAFLLETRSSRGVGGSDYVLVAPFRFEASVETLAAARAASRDDVGSQHLVQVFEALLRQTPAAHVVDVLSAEIVGHSSSTADASEIGLSHIPYLAGFYHYGWILALRIDREMLRMDLSPSEISNSGNAQTIIRHRILLIQIQRCLLNEDRSNNNELKEVCKNLVVKYKINDRFQRLSQVHRSMEEHLDNTLKVSQTRATRATNATVRLLTFSAIPLGILGVLLAINLSSSIFGDVHQLMSNSTLLLIVVMSFAVPFVLLGTAMLLDVSASIAAKLRNAMLRQ